MIARAAEISLLLLLGRYEKFKEMYDKNEIDEVTLVRAVNETFLKLATLILWLHFLLIN